MRCRLIGAALAIVLFAGGGCICWRFAGMPPLGFVLSYGYPSPMSPTGRTLSIEGMELVEIGPGYFKMGSHDACEPGDLLGKIGALLGIPSGRQPRHDSEFCPPHWVEFSEGFWIARTNVTNAQYSHFDRTSPFPEWAWYDQGRRVPRLSAARRYCAWLSEKSGLPIRLPTEAEWECACLAGGEPWFSFTRATDGHSRVVDPYKSLPRNAWGIDDMLRPPFDWCEDDWHDNYEGAPNDGSAWKNGLAGQNVVRGAPEIDWPLRRFRSCRRDSLRCISPVLRRGFGEDGASPTQRACGVRPAFSFYRSGFKR